MVVQFIFPADFNPMFRKEYVVSGNKFVVEVQELGIAPKRATGAQLCFHWAFRILVNGNNIMQGPYYWGVDKRQLTMENVANHLATYWGHSKEVEEAQGLAENNEEVLNDLCFKCAAWMHEYFMQTDAFRDFEIIHKFMDENGWAIMISPNYLPGRILEFTKVADHAKVAVTSYTIDSELEITL